jgi:hypothetical protein
MFTCIRVSDNNIEHLKVVKDDTRRSISFLNSRTRPKTEFRKDRRNYTVVECDIVDYGTIRAVSHCSETEIQLVTLGGYRLRYYDDRNECGVVHIVVRVDFTRAC